MGETVRKFIRVHKKHFIYLGILLISVLASYREHIANIGKIRIGGDIFGLYYFSFTLLKRMLLEYHQFPFWSATQMGGFPFFAYPQMMSLYPMSFLLYIIPDIQVLLNVMVLLTLFLGGAFMYLAISRFGYRQEVALVGGLLFSLNGFARWMSLGWLGRLNAFIWFPLIFLFIWKALHSKKWFGHSLLAGLTLALQYYSSGVNVFLYSVVIIGSIYIVFIVHKNFVQRLVKISFVSGVVLSILGGLILPQVIPLLEFSEISSQRGFPYDQSIGHKVNADSPFDYLRIFVSLFPGHDHHSAKVGWIGFFFVLLSLSVWRKRYVMVLLLILVLSVLIGTGTRAYFPLWKFVPGFDRIHHVNRSMGLFAFSAAFLAAIGFNVAYNWLKKKVKKSHLKVAFLVIALLIVGELGIYRQFEWRPFYDFDEILPKNELLQYVSEQPGLFRINNFNTHYIAGHASGYIVAKNQQMLYGITSVWIPEYFNIFLSVSNTQPAKFWGILNTKYVYADEQLDSPGLRFINEFNKCEECIEDATADRGVSGPYLYENELYLPRAYFTDNAILVVGSEDAARQTMYGVMVNGNFNPADSVIVMGEHASINEYSVDFLSNFKAIILTQGSVNQNSGFLLQQYVDRGGQLFPNILQGETGLNSAELERLLQSFNRTYDEVDEAEYTFYSPNKQRISLVGKEGFLVLAEKYYMFDSWRSFVDGGKIDFLRVNGVGSGVLVSPESKELFVRYTPKFFWATMSLMILILFAILAYFTYPRYLKWQQKQIGSRKISSRVE